jgi:uncharacterized protein (TIGR02391 family)
MVLFPDDVQAINELLQQRAGLDSELVEACWQHIELGQYDVAVFKAFRVLEGRIQHRSGIEGEGAAKTLSQALATRGPLTKKMGLSSRQAAHLRDLLRAAFSVFRNPEAHPQEAIVEYGSAECQALLSFVNLMLKILDRQPEAPLEAALKQIRKDIGVAATRRLTSFLDRAESLDLRVVERKTSFSFRARALRRTSKGELKRGYSTVFYLVPTSGDPKITIPGGSSKVLGFDYEPYREQLRDLGFVEGWGPELDLHLREHNSVEVLEQLYVMIRSVVEEINQALATRGEEG